MKTENNIKQLKIHAIGVLMVDLAISIAIILRLYSWSKELAQLEVGFSRNELLVLMYGMFFAGCVYTLSSYISMADFLKTIELLEHLRILLDKKDICLIEEYINKEYMEIERKTGEDYKNKNLDEITHANIYWRIHVKNNIRAILKYMELKDDLKRKVSTN